MNIIRNSMKHPALLLSLSLLGGMSSAATFNVHCENGDDLHTFLATAVDGDVFNISGTCYAQGQTFVVNSSVDLIGTASGALKPTLDGHFSAADLSDASRTMLLQTIAGKTVAIKNLTLQYSVGSSSSLVRQYSSNLNISNCTIINNNANRGGSGLYITGGLSTNGNVPTSFVMSNSTVSNNTGILGPAGVYAQGSFSQFTITNSTITNNLSTKPNGSDGFYYGGTGAAAELSNNIIIGNQTTAASYDLHSDVNITGGGVINLNGSNITGTESAPPNATTNLGGGINDFSNSANPNLRFASVADVKLTSLMDNGGLTSTIALDSGSNAINFSQCSLATDQRGAPRPGVGKTKCDSGAYETGDARLVATSNPVVFPSVNKDSSSSASVSVTNTGNSAAVGSGNYSINNPVFTIAGTTNSLNVPINSETALPLLTFTPTQSGVTSTGQLSVSYGPSAASPLSINLSGQSNVAPPTPQMKDILAYFAQGVKAKTIKGLGKSVLLAKIRLVAFGAGLVVSDQLINKNKINDACLLLQGLVKTSDGKDKPSDLITGSGVAQLNQNLIDLRLYIGCAPIAPLASDNIKDNDAGTATTP